METSSTNPSQVTRKLLIAICIIGTFLVLTIIGIALVIFNNAQKMNINTNNTQMDNSSEETQSDKSNSSEQEHINTLFEGNYFTATLPENWTMVEYSTAEGMYEYAITENVGFKGLTGMEIFDENGNKVFFINGIDGIGGGGGCSSIGVFADTEDSYVESVKNETNEMGFEPTEEIDLSYSTYSEVSTMGLRFRRVNNVLYTTKNDNLNVFNTVCGVEGQFVKIENLSFSITENQATYSANAYSFGIPEIITDEHTLEHLDEVLNSIVIK